MKEQYYGEIIARSVMFSNCLEDFLSQLDKTLPRMKVNLTEVLGIANATFIEYADAGFLSDQGKGNVYMYLHWLNKRNLSDEERRICSLYYPRIIDMLNNDITNENIEEFYRIELATRKNNKKYYNERTVSKKDVFEQSKNINNGIVFDFKVLYSNLDAPEQEYWNSQIELIASSNFIESARYLVSEYSGLMSEDNFKNRLCTTLEKKENMARKYRRTKLSINKKAKLKSATFNHSDKTLYKQISGM